MKSEEKLIEILKKYELPKKRLISRIGDDCAYLLEREGKVLVLSVDSQVDGIHFKREWFPPYYIGYRAMAASLSDLASKGAVPLVALIDLHIPDGFSESFIDEVYRGMYSLSRKFNFSIGGGNITRDSVFSLSITVIGECDRDIPMRSGAKPGDYVYITGDIGRSKLFIEIVNKNGTSNIPREVFEKFATPLPRFSIMKSIRKRYKVNASIDISDGLGIDASRVSKSSGIDIYIYEERVPLHPILKQYKKDVFFALQSGEEYEILFTTKEVVRKSGITLVGETKKGSGKTFLINSEGKKVRIDTLGFDHLKGE